MRLFKRKPKEAPMALTEQKLFQDNRPTYRKVLEFVKWYILVQICLYFVLSQVVLYMVLSGRYEFRSPVTDRFVSAVVLTGTGK